MVTFCSRCGKELAPGVRFCSACGTAVGLVQPAPVFVSTRLTRPRMGRVIAGVCAGLANSYGWDIAWVRVIAVLATVFSSGAGLIAYVVFWLVMPEEVCALPVGMRATPPSVSYGGPGNSTTL